MSAQTLRDHITFSVLNSEKKHENSYKGGFTKSLIENSTENFINEVTKKLPTTLASTPPLVDGINGVTATTTDVTNFEVEYIDSENLEDLLSVDSTISTLLVQLDSKDWILVCEALNNVRQISIYHKEKLLAMLDDVLKLIVKCLKNPRSAVCKTAIMTTDDIFKAYNDSIIESLDPLLLQLFLRSSQDKRFVCEVAERALITMTTCINASMLLAKLQFYLKHKNPKIRAKASMCFCRSVPRLGIDGIQAYGIDKLIQVAANQLSDQLPESREAARKLALELQAAYAKCQLPIIATAVDEAVTMDLVISWEDFCRSKLSVLNAQAILRVTTTTSGATTLLKEAKFEGP
ncbi:ARM repeat superfamily protein [Zostera marina]|uniref:ARM repeat superfamily protein n=1 Tax=Zostera marina TaxID=29655 RepID=A0A0K9PJA1_ZOSMR|nr:ARM repeat superfamily protein [Zostera marina]